MKMKRILSFIVMSVLSCTMLLAQSIVGKWKIDNPSKFNLPADAVVTINFQNGDKWNMNLDVTMTQDMQPGMPMALHAIMGLTGNYAAVNGVVSMARDNREPTLSKMEVNFPGMEASKAALLKKTIAGYMPQLKAQFTQQMSQLQFNIGSSPYTISGNTLTIDNATFTKVASTSSKTTKKRK